ncbi:MAG: hypothetical protein KIT56_06200 [Gammaproteobacteria bacterium]|nr:hypothetical protein [Gammaproteobacteria bacterium]MCW5583457.1 hypothetical protein [Gammaproteobacteria bacterium]
MNNRVLISLREQVNGISYFIFAALLPVLFTSLWLLNHSQLPTSDATDYLITGHKIYLHFTENGFWYGLLHFDIARGWRPIFFSVLVAPFLLISHDNLSFAYHAVTITCVFTSAVYIYLLSRLLLDRWPSIIAANVVCLLPFVLVPGLDFFAEIALFPAVIGSLYHLIQSDYFRHKKHAIGFIICFSLAIVIRPVEAVTELFFVLIVFLFSGWYRGIFSIKQIFSVIALGFSALFLLFLYVGTHFLHHYPFHPIDGGTYDIRLAKSIYHTLIITVVGVLLAWGTLAFINLSSWCRQRCQRMNKPLNDPPLIFVFSTIFVLALMWFLPDAFKLYVWVYRTSFGDIAHNTTHTVTKPPVWNVLQSFTIQESAAIVLGTMLIASLSLLTMGKQTLRHVCLSFPFLYLLLLVPFPAWEVLNTIQSSSRKLNLAFPAFILALLLIGLQRGKWWGLRLSVVTGLLITQFIFALSFIYPSLSPLKTYTQVFGTYPQPVTLRPNPHDEVIDFLNQQNKQYQLKLIVTQTNVETALPIDPFLLGIIGQVQHLPYVIGFQYHSTYSELDIEKTNRNHAAVLLTDKKSDMVISNEAAQAYAKQFEHEPNPTLKVWYRFLYYYASNQLGSIGWKVGPCITVKARDNYDYLGCLLLAEKR